MNIGFVGIIHLWLNLLWILYWPIPLALLYLFIFRKSISKKIIFLVAGITLGFVINYIIEFGFLKLVIVDPAKPLYGLPMSRNKPPQGIGRIRKSKIRKRLKS